jgi:hypothetical protein
VSKTKRAQELDCGTGSSKGSEEVESCAARFG